MTTYTPDDLARAKRYKEAAPPVYLGTPAAVYFDWELAGPNGAGFVLYREPHHSDEDIARAKSYLRAERDVVTLRVAQPERPATTPG